MSTARRQISAAYSFNTKLTSACNNSIDNKNSNIHISTRVAPNLTFSNSADAEFGRISELKFARSRIGLKLVFWSQNNMPVIKLMASTMLSAAIGAVYTSVLPLFCYCLPVIDKICRILNLAMNQFCILNYFSSILVFYLHYQKYRIPVL